MSSPTVHDFAVKPATLEERVNTQKADYKTDIEHLSKQLAERDTRLLIVLAALIAVATAVLGILIRFP